MKQFVKLLFFDEAAIWQTQPNTYSWRPIGNPLAVPTSKARGIKSRLNLMGCVDFATGEVQYRELEANTTGPDVVAFLDALVQQADPACPSVLVLDRASIHTCKAVQEKRDVWREKGLIVVHLPPYSPELNPMEGQWRKLKYHALKTRHVEHKADLRRAVGGAKWGIAL
ncbi:IS630 family transposase [Deinococcus sp.]|uniref:IS630 family transposase n=1 Tax=Deinococcus sp. TaxID=47478 RepID=UPI003C7B7F93